MCHNALLNAVCSNTCSAFSSSASSADSSSSADFALAMLKSRFSWMRLQDIPVLRPHPDMSFADRQTTWPGQSISGLADTPWPTMLEATNHLQAIWQAANKQVRQSNPPDNQILSSLEHCLQLTACLKKIDPDACGSQQVLLTAESI